MIQPDKVRSEAKKGETENFKFRTYLKNHADEDELDKQFLRLHKESFADYDCSKCRNCCKMYQGSIPAEDIEGDAKYLEITPEQFINEYLKKEEYDMNYQTKHMPCDFLQEDENCKLGDCKPDSCKKYPYTDQPEGLSSLLRVLDVIEICPVASEIFERLKKEYSFKARR
ncbi:MAG: YkgJ family cysteine cluster protein [Lachnospiraceae bacterium]|nr:YkgJ family cysteine cluster protein [Lachnospiraceae bacterium]